jgi:hypothetical protein
MIQRGLPIVLKDVVFILGMGRSGTSALTRVLSLCGGSLPQDLLGATVSNETGHWEPIRALESNDRFLAAYGSNWFDPTLRVQLANGEPRHRRSEFVSEIVDFLDSCPKQQTLIIKDPRITAIADCWFEAVERLGGSVRIVIAVRPAVSVIHSLSARDGLSLELSTALWLKYNVLAVMAARGRRHVFVGYDDLLSDWRRQLSRITAQLAVRLSVTLDDEIVAFLRSDLRHHVSNQEPAEVFGGTWVGKLNSALSLAARDIAIPDGVVDETYRALVDGRIDVQPAIVDFESRNSVGQRRIELELKNDKRVLTHLLDESRRTLDETRHALIQAKDELANTKSMLDGLELERDKLRTRLDALSSEFSEFRRLWPVKAAQLIMRRVGSPRDGRPKRSPVG